MTGFNNNNIKLVLTAPKTYEVGYVENTQQSNLSKFASYLGIKVTECSGNGSDTSKEVAKPQNTFSSLSSYSPSERKEISSTLSNTTDSGSKQKYKKAAGNEKTGDYANESIS